MGWSQPGDQAVFRVPVTRKSTCPMSPKQSSHLLHMGRASYKHHKTHTLLAGACSAHLREASATPSTPSSFQPHAQKTAVASHTQRRDAVCLGGNLIKVRLPVSKKPKMLGTKEAESQPQLQKLAHNRLALCYPTPVSKIKGSFNTNIATQ